MGVDSKVLAEQGEGRDYVSVLRICGAGAGEEFSVKPFLDLKGWKLPVRKGLLTQRT